MVFGIGRRVDRIRCLRESRLINKFRAMSSNGGVGVIKC